MRTKYFVVLVFLTLLAVISGGIYWLSIQPTSVTQDATSDHKNATYTIQGMPVTLVDGIAEVESAPGSASKTITRYFGNELVKDVNGDGTDDVTFIITQETGGSGVFYYVVTAMKTERGYVGSDALFLGDRILPQTTQSGPERSVIVNYADRNPGEDFSATPSLGKSIHVLLNPETMELGEWAKDFEGESSSGGKLKADVFTGTLEEVNTGCFADGECYVVVGGKHVTAIMGWSQETVGTIQGVEGFGDLEGYIGRMVEVYAQDLQDETFTLYGSEGFYIKLLGENVSGSSGPGIAVGEPNPGIPPSGGEGDEPKPQIVRDGCVVGGCSAQLCGEAIDGDYLVSTCEYRAQYACYQVATCERQSDGVCGWTKTPELTQCLIDMEDEPVMEVY
jgi:hypothetical protein